MCNNATHQTSELDKSGTIVYSDGNFSTDPIDRIGCSAYWNFNKSIIVLLYEALASLSMSISKI